MAADDRRDVVSEQRRRWLRLAELIGIADRDGIGALHPDELDELARLYRRATADLAAAQARGRDQRLIAYLNGLAGRAAGLIYGGRTRRRLHPREFFLATIPRTFRRTFAYTATAFAVFALPALAAYLAAAANPAWADALFRPGLADLVESFLARDVPPGQYFADAQGLMGADQLSGYILVNNLRVALLAFALGITAGLGCLYVLAGNGLMLGCFLGVFAHHGYLLDPIGIVAPHGFLELSAIFIAGGAGLMIGWAIIDPGDRPRAEALVAAARQAIVLVAGALAILGVAAIIEGFVSPQATGVLRSNEARILAGGTAWLAMCAWLLLGGQGATATVAPDA
ncbi:MAG: stage II sporulation protein M [Armatimonadota bacterium]